MSDSEREIERKEKIVGCGKEEEAVKTSPRGDDERKAKAALIGRSVYKNRDLIGSSLPLSLFPNNFLFSNQGLFTMVYLQFGCFSIGKMMQCSVFQEYLSFFLLPDNRFPMAIIFFPLSGFPRVFGFFMGYADVTFLAPSLLSEIVGAKK